MNLLSLTLLLASSPATLDAAAGDAAIARAVLEGAPAGATRVEVVSRRDRLPAGCAPSSAAALGRILGSGTYTLKLNGSDRAGRSCSGWTWANTRVFARAWVTSKRLATGESMAGALTSVERELTAGHVFVGQVDSDAVASRVLDPNLAIEPQHVRNPAQIPGRTLDVQLILGDLVIDTQGQSVPCSLDSACAQLATGKRVVGTWTDGRLKVVLP